MGALPDVLDGAPNKLPRVCPVPQLFGVGLELDPLGLLPKIEWTPPDVVVVWGVLEGEATPKSPLVDLVPELFCVRLDPRLL